MHLLHNLIKLGAVLVSGRWKMVVTLVLIPEGGDKKRCGVKPVAITCTAGALIVGFELEEMQRGPRLWSMVSSLLFLPHILCQLFLVEPRVRE